MPEYQFAEKNGNIINVEYDGTTCLNVDQVKMSLEKAFGLFPYPVIITQVKNYEDVFKVTYTSDCEREEIFICAKGTTPGGRSKLKNEQRIQPKAKNLNFVNSMKEAGKKAIFLGVYSRDGQEIFCTWKVNHSEAQFVETPISKQIKITSIANAIKEGFVQQEKGHGVYACVFKPEFLYFYLKNSDWLHIGHIKEISDHNNNVSKINNNDSENLIGRNLIFYGIPGCGKSYTISAMLSHKDGFVEKAKLNGIEDPVNEENVIRTTFYLDYSNSDFVGQIYPVVDDKGNVKYEYVPGPFTKALTKAYLQKDMIYLVIEEINRGNAAAIFGDLFQLLDRLKSPQGDRVKGDSEYPISNSFIEGYFARTNQERKKDDKDLIEYKEGQIFIPHNLTILATMNTSDQNVFPLDTAFKRRWKMKKINPKDSKYSEYYVPNEKGEQIKWCDFLSRINTFILNLDDEFILEDKQIGPYFVTDDILVQKLEDIQNDEKVEEFNHKVFEYIWSDVAKFNREKWIHTPKYKMPNSYDGLLDLINEYGIKETLKPFNTEGKK